MVPNHHWKRSGSQEVVSSWTNPRPGVLHEQPKEDWILQGWIFEDECLRVTLVRGRPWVLEIDSHHRKRFFWPVPTCGETQSLRKGVYRWWKMLHCWKIYASEMWTYICSYCCSPHWLSSTPFLLKDRKILLKLIFYYSFHFALIFFFFFCLSLVPTYGESRQDINIDADLGY